MSVAGIRDVHQLGLSSSIFKTNDWGLNNVRVCHLPHVTSSGYTVEGFISLWWHQEPGFLLYFQSVLLRVQPSFILTATRVPAVMLSHWAGRRNGVLWAHGPGPCWGLWPHSPGLSLSSVSSTWLYAHGGITLQPHHSIFALLGPQKTTQPQARAVTHPLYNQLVQGS